MTRSIPYSAAPWRRHAATTPVLAACFAFLLLAAATAHAGATEASSRYDRERAACMHGSSNQDRATCLKEAGAALDESRHGGLSSPGTDELARNRLARCAAHEGADREACMQRMQAPSSTTGSSQSGGMLREATRPDKAQ
ncbi:MULTISPECIES: hypothetical protein [Ramlibacter]|uniref:Secreted protein n=1 Tax=Ramlibacter aquaticus TaxID=2780094 RepID=A0ABR9SIA8_9BURK|nr:MULTISPECIES: hypothetical protein [Ramlibacter]MBE7941629.1 hypothetical protein [Ramlibacter aquaticus]